MHPFLTAFFAVPAFRVCAAACCALAGCTCALADLDDLGTQLISIPFVLEDPTRVAGNGRVLAAAAFEFDDGSFFFAVSDTEETEDVSLIHVYEHAPANAFRAWDGAARLRFFAGDDEDLERIANGEAPQGEVARSRSSVWIVDNGVDDARVPFDASDFGDGEFERVVFVVDSDDPAARRCGDAAVDVDCACDVGAVASTDDAACCADVRRAFDACDALVVVADDDPTSPPPVHLRLLDR